MFSNLYALVKDVAGVQAVLGNPVRLYRFGQAPQDVAKPYAVQQTIAGQPENYLGERPDQDTLLVQVDVYAADMAGQIAACAGYRRVTIQTEVPEGVRSVVALVVLHQPRHSRLLVAAFAQIAERRCRLRIVHDTKAQTHVGDRSIVDDHRWGRPVVHGQVPCCGFAGERCIALWGPQHERAVERREEVGCVVEESGWRRPRGGHSGVDVAVRDREGPGNHHAAGEVRNRASAAGGGTNEPSKVERPSLMRVHDQAA